MKGLTTKGIKELEMLRRRVKRVYGVGRITLEQLNGILEDLDSVERKLMETGEYGEYDPKEAKREPEPSRA